MTMKFVNFLNAIAHYTGRIVAWLTLLMVMMSFLIVLLRYGFNFGSIAMQESVLYMHALVFMLGAAYTLKEDGHVRVDIFYHKMSVKNKAKVNLAGTLILLLPFSIFVAAICSDYVLMSWKIMERSSEAGGLAFVYINKSLLLLLPLTLILQGISEVINNVLIIKSPTPSNVSTNTSTNTMLPEGDK